MVHGGEARGLIAHDGLDPIGARDQALRDQVPDHPRAARVIDLQLRLHGPHLHFGRVPADLLVGERHAVVVVDGRPGVGERRLALDDPELAHVRSQVEGRHLGARVQARQALFHGHSETAAGRVVDDDVRAALANLPIDLEPHLDRAGRGGEVPRIAGVHVNHRRAGVVGPAHGLRDLVRGLGQRLVVLLALDAAVHGDTDDQRRHALPNVLHIRVRVGVGPRGLRRSHRRPPGYPVGSSCLSRRIFRTRRSRQARRRSRGTPPVIASVARPQRSICSGVNAGVGPRSLISSM